MTEEGLQALLVSQLPLREEIHGRLAVEKAKAVKIFTNDNSTWSFKPEHGPLNVTEEDLQNLSSWKLQMEADVNQQNATAGTDSAQVEPTNGSNDGSVGCLVEPGNTATSLPSISLTRSDSSLAETALPPIDPLMLKYDQSRAYDIVAWHLDQTLAGRLPPPLHMLIHGEGGTGKSKVIQTITAHFAHRGTKYMLLKAAYTGVAASLIDGKTTHTIAVISRDGNKPVSNKVRAKLQQF
jgi:hypothetical protein